METFAQFDEQLGKNILDFITQQTVLRTQKWPYEADANLLRLIMKVTDLATKDSCAVLASEIFAGNSRIWFYRFLYSNAVEDLFRGILSITYRSFFL